MSERQRSRTASTVRSTSSPALRGDVAERVDEAALELLAERDVPEAVPRLRVGRRRAARGTARRAAAARGRRATTVITERARQASDEPPAAPDPGLDGEHEQPDRRRQEQGQRVVADRQPEDDGRGHEAAIAAIGARGPLAALARRAGDAPGTPRRRAGAAMARSARWRACASACVPIAQTIGVSASPRPATTPSGQRPGQRADEVDGDAGGDRDAERRRAGSSGRPARRTAGARTDASQPSRTYVGKPVGWAVPSSGPTVWSSPVSQKPTPGSRASAGRRRRR